VNAAVLAPGTNSAPDVFLGITGTVLADTGAIPYTTIGASQFSGSGEELVLAGDATNPFGGLDFIYQVSVTAGPSSMEAVSAANFVGQLTDVGYCVGCPNVLAGAGAPTNSPGVVSRTSDGSAVKFDFTSPNDVKAPTGLTYDLVIKTGAKDFGAGTFEVLDGSSKTLNGYAPTPEPVSSGLLLGGLFGLGLVVKRRFSPKQN